jgi:hypothetical protein
MTTTRRLSFLLPVLVLAACKMGSGTPTDTNAQRNEAPSAPIAIAWTLKTTENDEGVPTTELILEMTGGVTHSVSLGEYQGSEGGNPEVEGALLTKTLWFAGGGYQFAVMRSTDDNGDAVLLAKKRPVDEEQEREFPWETVSAIPVPNNATITPAQ